MPVIRSKLGSMHRSAVDISYSGTGKSRTGFLKLSQEHETGKPDLTLGGKLYDAAVTTASISIGHVETHKLNLLYLYTQFTITIAIDSRIVR